MSDIITVLQIASFVAGAVWIVASIKSAVDQLRRSVNSLSKSVDSLNSDIIKHGAIQRTHDERIQKLERQSKTESKA